MSFDDNFVEVVAAVANTTSGIQVDAGAITCSVQDNHIECQKGNGILIKGGSLTKNLICDGNTIVVSSPGATGCGIRCESTCNLDGGSVSHNNANCDSGVAILIRGQVIRMSVIGNVIEVTSDAGVGIRFQKDTDIVGITCHGNVVGGIVPVAGAGIRIDAGLSAQSMAIGNTAFMDDNAGWATLTSLLITNRNP